MNITEMFIDDEDEKRDEYMNPAQDNEVPKLHDLRKTKLTLGKINQLRLIRDVRDFEKKNSLENIRKQYGKSVQAEAGI